MSDTTKAVEERAAESVAEVRAASKRWAALAPKERAERLREAGDVLLEDAARLAEIVHRETHKPLAESYAAEVLGVADLFSYWCEEGPALLDPRRGKVPKLDMPGKKARVDRLPRGVIAVISPWNYPVAIPMRSIVPALMAGNGVVLKPSEWTPRSGRWLVEQLRETLGPIVGVLEGAADAGRALIEAGPDMVIFTGSTKTGREVAVACAERGIPCEQELGGKDCAVVLEDADIDRASAGITWGILTNAGQNCAGIERVLLHADIAEAFLDDLVSRLEEAAPDIPPLVTDQQRNVVLFHIQNALDTGGRLLTGGIPTSGDDPIPPTLIAEVPRSSLIWREETFGPVAAVEVCGSDDALVEAANDSSYGLGASVWSGDKKRAERVARRLEVGMVWINNHSFTGALPDLPWTGCKASGTGITNSPEALFHMTRPRLLVTDTSDKPEPWWYPYTDKMIRLMRAAVRRQRDGGLTATIRTLGRLMSRQREMR